MDRRLCIECIKMFDNINFTESIEEGNIIGYIDDNNRHIKVLYLEDNHGGYLSLEYSVPKKANADYVSEYLSHALINGRHKVTEDSIILSSIFPVLDERFLQKQIKHSLIEIWSMANITINAPE